ncbi:MAG TPA: adenosylhomocysteinase, partial [Thermoprotei archaeon]|nr:adenosylhomocysteinase [Thermoprotei archaeon]
NVEINLKDLEDLSVGKERIRKYVDKYMLRDGRKIYLIGEGRLVNLVAAEGHPPDVMMNSFANQLLSLLYIIENRDKLEKRVYQVPREIDEMVARYTLKGWNIEIDELTEDQIRYWESWRL